MSNKAIDIKGQLFGKLITLRLVSKKRSDTFGLRSGANWLCRCKCGRYKIANGRLLRLSKVTSCGCLRTSINRGERYGMLTAIKLEPDNRGQGAVWVCECECGNSASVRAKDMRYGNTLSCGCLKNQDAMNARRQALAIERPWRCA